MLLKCALQIINYYIKITKFLQYEKPETRLGPPKRLGERRFDNRKAGRPGQEITRGFIEVTLTNV